MTMITKALRPRLRHAALPMALLLAQAANATVFSATLPASRSVQVGDPATFFGTMINASEVTASGCRVELLSPIDATLSYQTANASNEPVGTPNTPASIPAGGTQAFLLELIPNSEIAPLDVELTFTCDNSGPAPITPGLNTLLFSASTQPTPDLVALAATPSGDGIAVIPPDGQLGFFSVASVNVGSPATVQVGARGTGAVPTTLLVCETDPGSGACLAAPAAGVDATVGAAATPTFAAFLGDAPGARIPFDPAANRVFLEFKENNLVKGSTSVAARSTTATEVFSAEVSPDTVQTRCINCHRVGGVSQNTRLVFVRDSVSDHLQQNEQEFRDYLQLPFDAVQQILDKVRGRADHGGGMQLGSGSADYNNLRIFLTLLDEEVNPEGS